MAEEENLQEEEGKKKKKKDKKSKKGENFDATVSDSGAMYTDAEEEEGGGFFAALIVIFIVIIWLAILALLVKLDVGGFGSGILYPVLKDVKGLNKILPDNIDEELEAPEFDNLSDAVKEIERLRVENEKLRKGASSSAEAESDEVAKLKEEIRRLQTFEDSQMEFQKLKTEFYEEVVFGENAPTADEYQKYYEQIDPDNAEYIYRQVVQQLETDDELSDYVLAYSKMKPKQAASIFEMMVDNLNLVAKILEEMDPQTRGKILGVMDSEVASQLTKIMDPEY